MDIIRQRFHVGEFLVGCDIAVRVTFLCFPRVIDVDERIPHIFHAIAGHGIGYRANRSVIDAPGEFVPTVPAHGRSLRQAVVGDLMQRWRRDARGHGAFARRSTMCNHLGEGSVRTTARGHVQFVTHEFAFVHDVT